MKGKLEFNEFLGNIKFTYTEPIDSRSCHYISETIPERIARAFSVSNPGPYLK